jgi:tetratricopeptide (TPR) repeat protein
VEADSGFAEALFNLSHIAIAAANPPEAIGYLERAVDVDPDYADAVYNLAALYIQLDRFADAAPLLERHIRLDPKSASTHEARILLLACRAVMGRTPNLTDEAVGD